MGDSSSDAARAEMQSLVLQPFPRYSLQSPRDMKLNIVRGPALDGLSREQKIAYAAFNLEQHEQDMK